jgi:anti-sigma factor ChrR (cupin superfamily)
MATYSMDHDPEYWQFPERYREMVEFGPKIGVRGAFYPLGDPDNENTPMAVVLNMAPGYIVGRHSHPSFRFEVIVRGSIETEGRTLVAGDIMTAEPYEFYGPKICGPEGCTTIEIFSNRVGSHTRIAEGPDGEAIPANLLEGVAAALIENGVPRHLRAAQGIGQESVT